MLLAVDVDGVAQDNIGLGDLPRLRESAAEVGQCGALARQVTQVLVDRQCLVQRGDASSCRPVQVRSMPRLRSLFQEGDGLAGPARPAQRAPQLGRHAPRDGRHAPRDARRAPHEVGEVGLHDVGVAGPVER